MATDTQSGRSKTPSVGRGRRGDRLYRLRLDQYLRMVQAGILGDDEPVVLLDGLLVRKMTKGDPHETAAHLGMEALRQIPQAGWHVRKESPVALPGGAQGNDSVPEPDLSVVRGAIRDFAARTPGPGDVLLVVEVADSSLSRDRAGLARYAAAGIPVAWIVNLPGRCVEAGFRPTGPGPDPRYAESRTYGEADEVPVVIDGREVGRLPVKDLLP